MERKWSVIMKPGKWQACMAVTNRVLRKLQILNRLSDHCLSKGLRSTKQVGKYSASLQSYWKAFGNDHFENKQELRPMQVIYKVTFKCNEEQDAFCSPFFTVGPTVQPYISSSLPKSFPACTALPEATKVPWNFPVSL